MRFQLHSGRAASVAATLAVLALTGCGAISRPGGIDSVVDVPAAWSTADPAAHAAAMPSADWWARLGDPLLTGLVVDAMAANTSVGGAQAALRQARALRAVAAAALLPSLTTSGSASRERSAVPGGGKATNNVQAGLDGSWDPDVFGANRSALNATDATLRSQVANLGDVRVSIAAEVALDYIVLRSDQARLAIAVDNFASQQETLQITTWRLQAGLATGVDVEQARTSAEQTAAQVPALQTGIDQARHALAVLTGRPPGALADLLAAAAAVPQPSLAVALDIPAETLRQRPDVRRAEFQAVVALAQVDQARAALYPRFSISGSLGLSALTVGALTSGASVASSLLTSISWPIFDGGATRAQIDAQQAALDQSRQSYRAAVLTALKDVEDTVVALRDDRLRKAHLDNAAEAATNAAALARQRYASGLVDFQVVLDTQRTRLTAQDAAAAAFADVSSDHVRFYKALGGRWTPEPDLAVLSRTGRELPTAGVPR